MLWNFDETPYYQNEAGAQDKPTLALQGALVPLTSRNQGQCPLAMDCQPILLF